MFSNEFNCLVVVRKFSSEVKSVHSDLCSAILMSVQELMVRWMVLERFKAKSAIIACKVVVS